MTPETIAIVKSCVPILQEHGEALTRLFYQRMFTHNPEVKPFFNPIHQQEGTQQLRNFGCLRKNCAWPLV